MSKIVCVEIVVDTQGILDACPDPSQDPDNPTPVDNDRCYMVAQPAFARRGQASAHLHVKAHASGALQWRAISLSGNAGQGVILYAIEASGKSSVVGPASPVESQFQVPIPILVDARNTDPPTFSDGVANDYCLECEILGRGKARFDVQFYITKESPRSGELGIAGYFAWVSTLTIG